MNNLEVSNKNTYNIEYTLSGGIQTETAYKRKAAIKQLRNSLLTNLHNTKKFYPVNASGYGWYDKETNTGGITLNEKDVPVLKDNERVLIPAEILEIGPIGVDDPIPGMDLTLLKRKKTKKEEDYIYVKYNRNNKPENDQRLDEIFGIMRQEVWRADDVKVAGRSVVFNEKNYWSRQPVYFALKYYNEKDEHISKYDIHYLIRTRYIDDEIPLILINTDIQSNEYHKSKENNKNAPKIGYYELVIESGTILNIDEHIMAAGIVKEESKAMASFTPLNNKEEKIMFGSILDIKNLHVIYMNRFFFQNEIKRLLNDYDIKGHIDILEGELARGKNEFVVPRLMTSGIASFSLTIKLKDLKFSATIPGRLYGETKRLLEKDEQLEYGEFKKMLKETINNR